MFSSISFGNIKIHYQVSPWEENVPCDTKRLVKRCVQPVSAFSSGLFSIPPFMWKPLCRVKSDPLCNVLKVFFHHVNSFCMCNINLWVASRFIIRPWKCHWNSGKHNECVEQEISLEFCPSGRPVQHSHGLVHTAHYLVNVTMVLDILKQHHGQLKNSDNFCGREIILWNFAHNISSLYGIVIVLSHLWAESTPWLCDYLRPLVRHMRMKTCHIMYNGKI